MNKINKKLAITFLGTFVVAACSIMYELLLAHTISLVAGSAVIWYGIVIGVFLGSLGVGSFVTGWVVKKVELLEGFLRVEFTLIVVGGISAMIVFFAHMFNAFLIVQGMPIVGKAVFFGMIFLAIAGVGFLSGIELPLLIKLGNRYAKRPVANRILAVDYFGSLVGAVLFPLVLISIFSVVTIGILIALFNLVAALIIFMFIGGTKSRQEKSKIIIFVILACMIYSGLFWSDNIDQYFAKKYYNYISVSRDFKTLLSFSDNDDEIKRVRSSYQVIDLVRLNFNSSQDVLVEAYTNDICSPFNRYEDFNLYLNGDWQFNAKTERIYHEYFAHMPIIFSGRIPRKVLVLGGGDGLLDRELLKYKEIEKIVHVDLDAKMIELAKTDPVLLYLNNGALNDERVNVEISDGFFFVRSSTEKFDAVYIDFPTPTDYNLSKLYSKEFYTFVSEVVNDDGFIALDVPGVSNHFFYNKKSEMEFDQNASPLGVYRDTIRSAGFKNVVPFVSHLNEKDAKALIFAKDHFRKIAKERKTKSPFLLEKKIDKQAEKLIRGFILGNQETFIFATKNDSIIDSVYPDNMIETCMLNKENFSLATNFDFERKEGIDPRNINSIIKPVIPLGDYSQIKFPYTLR